MVGCVLASPETTAVITRSVRLPTSPVSGRTIRRKSSKLDGSKTYTQTYPKDALPASKVGYFWSVIAVDSAKFQVIPNPLNRFLLNKQSGLEPNPDGSLTLAFAPRKPVGLPKPNWLPTPEGQPYNLTYRFYGPSADIENGEWFPPPLVEQN
jgi:hypothetical protein